MERAFGREVLFTREGGSGPEADLADILGAPLVFLAVGLDSDRIHAPNEKAEMALLLKGAEAAAYLWSELAGAGPAGPAPELMAAGPVGGGMTAGGGVAGSGAGEREARDVTGDLGEFVLARSDVDRASARREDADWIAATWADQRSRVLVLDEGQALVRFGDGAAELVLVPPAQAPEGVRFLLGTDGGGTAYFGLGLPGWRWSARAPCRPLAPTWGSQSLGSTRPA